MLPYPHLTGSQCIVYDALRDLTSKGAKISHMVLSERTGYHRLTVRRALDSLEEAGFIEIRDRGRGRSPKYIVYDLKEVCDL